MLNRAAAAGGLLVIGGFLSLSMLILSGHTIFLEDQWREWVFAERLAADLARVFDPVPVFGRMPWIYGLFFVPHAWLGVPIGPLWQLPALAAAAGCLAFAWRHSATDGGRLAVAGAALLGLQGFFFLELGVSITFCWIFAVGSLLALASARPGTALLLAAASAMMYFPGLPWWLAVAAAVSWQGWTRAAPLQMRLRPLGLALLSAAPVLAAYPAGILKGGSLENLGGTPPAAFAYLGFGPVPSLLLLLAGGLSFRFRPQARPLLRVVFAHWLLAAAGLSLKADYWAPQYSLFTGGLTVFGLLAAWPLPRIAWLLVAIYIAGSQFAVWQRPPWREEVMFEFVGGPAREPGDRSAIRLQWQLAAPLLKNMDARRIEGEVPVGVRWAREFREQRADNRPDPEVWTLAQGPWCATDAPGDAGCRFRTQAHLDGIPLTGPFWIQVSGVGVQAQAWRLHCQTGDPGLPLRLRSYNLLAHVGVVTESFPCPEPAIRPENPNAGDFDWLLVAVDAHGESDPPAILVQGRAGEGRKPWLW